MDEHFDVLHFSASAGRFMQAVGDAIGPNLLDLVHGDLRMDLRGALNAALLENRARQTKGLQMRLSERHVIVDIVIAPIQDSFGSPRHFIVHFQESATLPDASGQVFSGTLASDNERIRQLEAELRCNRERLQAAIEALENTNEELNASNEEYQLLNEELQSANEELAASSQELHSANAELAQRVQELGRVNSDLKNLLESTRIATVFLDSELRVMNFTPAVVEVFHMVQTDIGRPIGHIKSRVVYDELQDDVRRVLRTLGILEREVGNPATHARYMVRVLPYRSVENVIAGAVMTFTDVTPLRASEERLRLVTEHIPQFVWTALDGGNWTWTSRQWSEYTGQAEVNSRGLGWLECVHPDDRAAVVAAWKDAAVTGLLSLEHRVRSGNGAYRWFHARAAPLAHGAGKDGVEWFGTSTDVHEMRELRDQQAVMVAELQHRTRNLLAVIQSLTDKTLAGSVTLDDFRERFRERLSALSRVQGLLSRKTQGTKVTFDELLRTELIAHGVIDADGRGSHVMLDGPPGVQLRSGMVQTFALALHELATNAVKYGALSTPTGRMLVRWRVENHKDGIEHARLQVEWQESGAAKPEENGNVRAAGYGRELIQRALPYQLGAETDYTIGPEGVRCTISVPIAADQPGAGGMPDAPHSPVRRSSLR